MAGEGNSIVRMYRPGPRNSSPSGVAGVTLAIFTPGPNDWPPLVDLKIHSEKVTGAPVQWGSLTAIFSAVTYRVPDERSTIGHGRVRADGKRVLVAEVRKRWAEHGNRCAPRLPAIGGPGDGDDQVVVE